MGVTRKPKRKAKLTAKQKSARRRNIKIAQSSRKRNAGSAAKKGVLKTKAGKVTLVGGRKGIKGATKAIKGGAGIKGTKKSAFKTQFKKSFKELKFMEKGKGGVSRRTRTAAALSEAGDLLKGRGSKRAMSKANRMRSGLNKAFKKRGIVEKISRDWAGSGAAKRGWKIKGKFATRPFKIKKFVSVD